VLSKTSAQLSEEPAFQGKVFKIVSRTILLYFMPKISTWPGMYLFGEKGTSEDPEDQIDSK
jgi:hypothetical protein